MVNGARKIGKASRTEPCIDVSEFNLSKPSVSKPITITNLTKNLGKRKDFKKTDEIVKKIARKVQPLAKPLEAVEAKKVRRSVGYTEVKRDLNEWEPVVTANRAKTTISFPLNYHNYKSENLIDFLEKTNDSSENEQEGAEHRPKNDNRMLKLKLNKEEMLQRVRQIAKIRAQQSYEMKKNRYQNKIKGRKYRKILKKSKLSKQLKEFEMLKESDPEKALEKLDDLERVRAKERATLRHRSVGKWAKHMQTKAKYNAESRKELADQLALSRDLTEKHTLEDESEDSDNSNDSGCDSDSGTENGSQRLKKDSTAAITSNNWFKTHLAEKSDDEDFFDTSAGDATRSSSSSSSNSTLTPVSALKQPKFVHVARRNEKALKKSAKVVSDCEKAEQIVKDVKKIIGQLENGIKSDKKQRKKITKEKQNKSATAVSDLSFPKKVKFADEEGLSELMETTENDVDRIETQVKTSAVTATVEQNENARTLHTNESVTSTSASLELQLDSSVVENGEDYNDSDCSEDEDFEAKEVTRLRSGQGELFLEAIADDDLVLDFEKEKKKEIEDSIAPDVDLTLPGWGSWVGGKQHSVEKCRKRKRRFIIAMPKAEKRRDDNKGFLLVNEDMDQVRIKEHQVSDLPYPFKKVKTFEESIQKPIGNTFVPELEHLKLTKPKVITKMGTVIDPICKKDLRK